MTHHSQSGLYKSRPQAINWRGINLDKIWVYLYKLGFL